MSVQARITTFVHQFTLFFFLFIGGLATSRILYEWLFPRWLWLGSPLLVFPLVTAVTFIIWLLIGRRIGARGMWLAPLLLNFIYLSNPTVDLIQSRLIFGASIWLCALLFSQGALKKRPYLGTLFILVAILPLYLLTVSALVGRDDTFEFQVVTPKLGIVHPTGYPLYLLLGRLFTLLPFGSVAWRLNFASIVYGLGALCLIYVLLVQWWKRPLPAILTATAIGVSLTFWGQAIVAEVYALHALIVAAILLLVMKVHRAETAVSQRHLLLLPLLLGLGMSNHVTTVFMLLPVLLVLLFYFQRVNDEQLRQITFWLKMTAAGLLPLLLYAYLPLRWQAVNGEPMGWGRFVDWVVGGRFQGALQWSAWLNDLTRYEVVWRLFLDNWGLFNLLLALLGLGFLLIREWQTAVLLLTIFTGYSFYALNYYVPDLAVFLIPAQMMVGLFWGYAFYLGMQQTNWGLGLDWLGLGRASGLTLKPLFLFLFLIAMVNLTVAHWRQNDQSMDDGRTQWGTAVLNLPIPQNAAILADSLKFPPLFYLQQSEGIREDLDISVWPDEAAYLAQLEGRLAAGQPVFLARFLPGLEGRYHLNSVGPLIHVSTTPLERMPDGVKRTDMRVGEVVLRGYSLQPQAATDPTQSAVTLYWQAETAVTTIQHVYVRWQGFEASDGQHPANNFYPTVAWKGDEIVADYVEWPIPIVSQPQQLAFQVALGPPFASENALAWQTVTMAEVTPLPDIDPQRPLRVIIDQTAINGITAPQSSRPSSQIDLLLTGKGEPSVSVTLTRAEALEVIPGLFLPELSDDPILIVETVTAGESNGRLPLIAQAREGAICGWMRPTTSQCVLTAVDVSGVPLPKGSVNFEDKIALLEANVNADAFASGGEIDVAFHWQALTVLDENYTIFVQLLDENSQIVTQLDSWPLQGTQPTSQWQPGEVLVDPYRLTLPTDLPAGTYRLQVGFYLLETLRRLSVVDEEGRPIGDHFFIQSFSVGE